MSRILSNFALKCTQVNFLSVSSYKKIKTKETHLGRLKWSRRQKNKGAEHVILTKQVISNELEKLQYNHALVLSNAES
jgi:hypothetical protein